MISSIHAIIEAALLAAGKPLNLEQLQSLWSEEERPEHAELQHAIEGLQQACADRGVELVQVASGYRYQVKPALAEWVQRLWEERPARYSRALLETLALIAYRQPITRAEIEAVRGVAVSTNIIKTLQEQEWIRIVGYREVPGKPALYATTKHFLDHFNLQHLEDLPPLTALQLPTAEEIEA